ncbi:MAG: hypothetical protein PHE73_08825 [Sulfurovaceae bacterium]|nr:hypothetical protein [Sulfurovaceae bacterium]
MAQDDLDAMLEGDNQDNLSDSQSGNQSSGSNADDKNTAGQSEEVEFQKLSGNAQDRFRQLWQEKQNAIAKAQKLEQLIQNQPGQQQQTQTVTSDVKDAVNKLDAVGIATKDFVSNEIQSFLAKKTYYDELDKMEGKLNGEDGRPKFTREEYFDYVEKHPQFKNYLPEDVYEKMYKEELSDWTATNGDQRTKTKRTQALRPTRTANTGGADLTVDEIESKLKSLPEPQRSEWYAKNLSKINAAISQMKG